jgi:hypothetical protein
VRNLATKREKKYAKPIKKAFWAKKGNIIFIDNV